MEGKEMSDLIKSGDRQQYPAKPQKLDNPDDGVIPSVKLVWMTPDPLGAMALFTGVYKGRFYEDLSEVTDEDRYEALAQVQKTHLQAPLEVIKLHFLIEGVDRAFTHQLVRQRTAVYAQESMRFSVLGKLIDSTTLPPSLQGTERSGYNPEQGTFWEMTHEADYELSDEDQRKRMVWDYTIETIDKAYHHLVESGMPAEEARGLLPHCTATRINYVTDLRNLIAHAGNRLCTQAQFHWRKVFNDIVGQIRAIGTTDRNCTTLPDGSCIGTECMHSPHAWQYRAIADSAMFRPVCYQLGHCPFEASFDRACTIRDRVQANAQAGRPSSEWHKDIYAEEMFPGSDLRGMIPAINPAEWLLDPHAARL